MVHEPESVVSEIRAPVQQQKWDFDDFSLY